MLVSQGNYIKYSMISKNGYILLKIIYWNWTISLKETGILDMYWLTSTAFPHYEQKKRKNYCMCPPTLPPTIPCMWLSLDLSNKLVPGKKTLHWKRPLAEPLEYTEEVALAFLLPSWAEDSNASHCLKICHRQLWENVLDPLLHHRLWKSCWKFQFISNPNSDFMVWNGIVEGHQVFINSQSRIK